MRTILVAGTALSALLIAGASLAAAPDDLPPNALPGHCYQHVLLPAVTESYREQIVDTPEHTATRTIPAVYGEVEKRVVVREGRVEHVLIPPTYRMVTETEVVRPETVRTEVIPAEYEVFNERVLVREAHTEWRRGEPGPVSDPDMPRWPSDRDILCLIEVPAEYRVMTRHVLRSPERVIHTTLPAEVRTRTREVIDQPAHDETRVIEPVYSMVKERVVVQPERVETYIAPATVRSVIKTRVVTPEHYEWREYACRNVRHRLPRPHPQDSTDGERGAMDPAKSPVIADHPRVLAENFTTVPGLGQR